MSVPVCTEIVFFGSSTTGSGFGLPQPSRMIMSKLQMPRLRMGRSSSFAVGRSRSHRNSVRADQFERLCFRAALDVRLELWSEFLDGILDRPAGAVGQATDGGARHGADSLADL